ncbi:hypothetical protein KEM48_010551 [Puccinia striiformis f. sp. tritici PST-130]|nr:hypothetical protein KEM48_010551 [Puccinia striiformis f. sp. tritici PST-130]
MVSIPNYSSSSAILFFLQLFLLLQSSYSQKNSNLNPGPYPDFSTTQYSKKVVLELSEKVISADCTNRPSVVINGTFPGPELRFKVGDQVEIRVHNLLKFNTTLHWHGLSQYGSPFADGTEKISQYAIPPGGYFDYIFQLEANSAGTYIYHAHVGFHLMTCHGAFIVEDLKSPPFKYDKELVMLFADYYHNLEQQITAGLDEVPFKWLGEPQSMVVNGTLWVHVIQLVPLAAVPPAIIIALLSNQIRLIEVIGITVLTYLYFGIEDHPALSVIEADGGYVRPASTEHIQLHSGQLSQTSSSTRRSNTWLTEKFEALDPNEVAPTASEVTRRITITGQQRKAPDGHINWFINGEKYVETQPQIPFLVRAYTTKLKPDYEAAAKNNGFDKKLRAYPVKFNDVVEFVVLNQVSTAGVTETHPWHRGALPQDAHPPRHRDYFLIQTRCLLLQHYTSAGHGNGWMVLRMRAETPGAFLMHCHTQPHAAMGMAAVILVGIENLPPLPPGYINKFVTPPPS